MVTLHIYIRWTPMVCHWQYLWVGRQLCLDALFFEMKLLLLFDGLCRYNFLFAIAIKLISVCLYHGIQFLFWLFWTCEILWRSSEGNSDILWAWWSAVMATDLSISKHAYCIWLIQKNPMDFVSMLPNHLKNLTRNDMLFLQTTNWLTINMSLVCRAPAHLHSKFFTSITTWGRSVSINAFVKHFVDLQTTQLYM